MKKNSTTKYVSQNQLSKHLNCSPHELIRFREKGLIKPHHKEGRCLMYDLIRTEVDLIKNLTPGYSGKMRDICKRDIDEYIKNNPESDIAIMFKVEDEQSEEDQDILNYNASRALYEFNKAKIKEMERMEKEGKLIKSDDVKKVWEKHISDVRSQLINLPSKVIAVLTDLDRDRAVMVRKKIDEIINDTLRSLAK